MPKILTVLVAVFQIVWDSVLCTMNKTHDDIWCGHLGTLLKQMYLKINKCSGSAENRQLNCLLISILSFVLQASTQKPQKASLVHRPRRTMTPTPTSTPDGRPRLPSTRTCGIPYLLLTSQKRIPAGLLYPHPPHQLRPLTIPP